MRRSLGRLVILAVCTTYGTSAAMVLCAKKSGVVVMRASCKKKESPLDLAQFGVVGPKGDKGDQGDPGTQGAPGVGPLTSCAPDSVLVGTTCMDKYEASVWRVPLPTTANTGLVMKIQQGQAMIGDLATGGATQLGTASDDYAPCMHNGQGCANDIYAASLPGVTPSGSITWFQAQEACANAGKRLPTNAEWQVAANGTPDPGPDNGTTDCNTTSAFGLEEDPVPTGTRSSCVSARGAFDMVGNLEEWVAEWVPLSSRCGTWSVGVSPTGDDQCLVGAETTGEPGALLRGGDFGLPNGLSGPLTVFGNFEPSSSINSYGFRCAR